MARRIQRFFRHSLTAPGRRKGSHIRFPKFLYALLLRVEFVGEVTEPGEDSPGPIAPMLEVDITTIPTRQGV